MVRRPDGEHRTAQPRPLTYLPPFHDADVDGDTIKCNGQNMRIMGHGKPFEFGVDAPEISRAKCQKERIHDQQAKRHLEELLRQPGTPIEDSGARDR